MILQEDRRRTGPSGRWLRTTLEFAAPDLWRLEARAPRERGGGPRRLWWVAALVLGAGTGALWSTWAAPGPVRDPAVTTAATLVESGCFCLPTPPLGTAPSTLTVLVLAGLLTIASPVVAVSTVVLGAGIVTATSTAAAAARAGWSPAAGPLAAILLATSPVLAAAAGVEAVLTVVLLAALLHAVVAVRPMTAGLVGGLLVLVRPDLALFTVLAAVVLRRMRTGVVATVLTAVTWTAAALTHRGPPVPEPWRAVAGGAAAWSHAGAQYLEHAPAATLVAVAALLAGLVTAVGAVLEGRAGEPAVILLGLGGPLHLVVLVATGVAPSAVALTAATVAALLLLALGAARAPREVVTVLAAGLVLAGAAYVATHDVATAFLTPGP